MTPNQTVIAGADIGGTKIAVSLADENGILIKLQDAVKLTGNNTAIPQQILSMIADACKRAGISQEYVQSLGVCTCSPFEIRSGKKVIVAPNLCGSLKKGLPNNWAEIPIEQELADKFSQLAVENDCVAAAVAEHTFGACQNEDNFAVVTWSTGIGTGLVVDGHVLRGKNSNAGHAGHMFIAEDGPKCGCGNCGDLEVMVSGPSIAKQYCIVKNVNNATTKEVFDAYRAGDAQAKEIIERAAKNFSRGMANICQTLDTKLFVFMGSVLTSDRNSDILLPLIKSEFYRSFPTMTRGVEFKLSDLGKYLGDIAALSLVMPKEWVENWRRTKPWENSIALAALTS